MGSWSPECAGCVGGEQTGDKVVSGVPTFTAHEGEQACRAVGATRIISKRRGRWVVRPHPRLEISH